jgi:hypothetical protein
LEGFVVEVDTGGKFSDGGISFFGEGEKSFSKRWVKFGCGRFCVNSAGSGGICGGVYGALGGFDSDPQPESATVKISIALLLDKFCILISFHQLSGLGIDGGNQSLFLGSGFFVQIGNN